MSAPALSEYVLGTDFGIYHGAGGTLVAAATDNQMNLTKHMIVVSNKQSGKAEQYRPGRGDGTASGTSRVVEAAGSSFSALFALYNAGTMVTIKYSSEVASTKYWEVDAYISELSRTDPDNDSSTFSYTFQFTSVIEEKTVSS